MENNIGEARRNYAATLDSGKFTQEDAARFFGVSKGTYSAWEQGVGKGLKGEQLKAIADKYQTTVDYLLQLSDNPGPRKSVQSYVLKYRDDAELDELAALYRSMTDEGRAQLMIFARGLAATYPKIKWIRR